MSPNISSLCSNGADQVLHSLIGIGEIVLLPLDVLKIKRQTNPEAFRGRGVFRIVADEGMGLYRGAGWTAARNAPGSFALFGGSAAAKQYLYKLDDYNAASFMQNFVASIAGAAASLVFSFWLAQTLIPAFNKVV